MTEKQRKADNKRRRDARAAARSARASAPSAAATDKATVSLSDIANILREGIGAISASASRIERAVHFNLGERENIGLRIHEDGPLPLPQSVPAKGEGKQTSAPPLLSILDDLSDRSRNVRAMAEALRSTLIHGSVPPQSEVVMGTVESHGPSKDTAYATMGHLAVVESCLEFFAQYLLPR